MRMPAIDVFFFHRRRWIVMNSPWTMRAKVGAHQMSELPGCDRAAPNRHASASMIGTFGACSRHSDHIHWCSLQSILRRQAPAVAEEGNKSGEPAQTPVKHVMAPSRTLKCARCKILPETDGFEPLLEVNRRRGTRRVTWRTIMRPLHLFVALMHFRK